MDLKGRALFNLLKMNADEHPVDVQPWQVEDLRALSIEQLFARLKKLGIILDEKSFSLYLENHESPEELAESLELEEMEDEIADQLYLLVFELWRRLCKDKFCLSIFCDELDQLIEKYDEELPEVEEKLQEEISFLGDILDEAFDDGGAPRELLQEISTYSAHDLEAFLIDYIADQIEQENTLYASELIEAFSPYAASKNQFELLKASMMALSDEELADRIYHGLLEEVKETQDLDMALQFAEHLVHHGNLKLFVKVAKEAFSLIRTEEDFQVLLTIMGEYFRCLDREEDQKSVLGLLEQRAHLPLEQAVERKDPALSSIASLF